MFISKQLTWIYLLNNNAPFFIAHTLIKISIKSQRRYLSFEILPTQFKFQVRQGQVEIVYFTFGATFNCMVAMGFG